MPAANLTESNLSAQDFVAAVAAQEDRIEAKNLHDKPAEKPVY